MTKFSSPFMAKSPLRQEKGEIRDASEILGDQPGYNKNTNTVMQAGTVAASSGGLGSGQSLSLIGKIGAGIAAGAGVVAGLAVDRAAKKRYNESQKKWKKRNAEIKARNSNLPQI